MIQVKRSKYDKTKIGIHFGRTVRHVSVPEAVQMIQDLIKMVVRVCRTEV